MNDQAWRENAETVINNVISAIKEQLEGIKNVFMRIFFPYWYRVGQCEKEWGQWKVKRTQIIKAAGLTMEFPHNLLD